MFRIILSFRKSTDQTTVKTPREHSILSCYFQLRSVPDITSSFTLSLIQTSGKPYCTSFVSGNSEKIKSGWILSTVVKIKCQFQALVKLQTIIKQTEIVFLLWLKSAQKILDCNVDNDSFHRLQKTDSVLFNDNVVFKLPLSVVLLYTSKMQIDEDSNELRINEFDCIIVIC